MVIIATSPTSLKWKALLKKLVPLPVFWNFVFLRALSLIRFVTILVLDTKSFNMAYWHRGGLRSNHCFANNLGRCFELFSNSSFSKQIFQVYIHCFKCNSLIFCVEVLVHFTVYALQLALDVSGLDDRRDNFHTVVFFLYRVVYLNYLHKAGSFLWIKMFCDNKDILKGPDHDIR